MLIALNGMGAAKYDPKKEVIEFFEKKIEHRQSKLDYDGYKKQEFISIFFSKFVEKHLLEKWYLKKVSNLSI